MVMRRGIGDLERDDDLGVEAGLAAGAEVFAGGEREAVDARVQLGIAGTVGVPPAPVVVGDAAADPLPVAVLLVLERQAEVRAGRPTAASRTWEDRLTRGSSFRIAEVRLRQEKFRGGHGDASTVVLRAG